MKAVTNPANLEGDKNDFKRKVNERETPSRHFAG